MKNVIILITLLTSMNILARQSKNRFTLVPILTYERVQKVLPTPRTTNQLSYGLRAMYGRTIFSGEAEITQSQEDEYFSNINTQYSDKTTKAKLGFRSTFNQKFLRFFIRAGAQATQTEVKTTVGSVTNTVKPDTEIDPYAGAGLGIQLLRAFRLNASYTAVFVDRPSGEIDSEVSLGFSVSI